MRTTKPKISGKDFADACQHFFRDTNELFGLKPSPKPPLSPKAAEILRGLQIGWLSRFKKP